MFLDSLGPSQRSKLRFANDPQLPRRLHVRVDGSHVGTFEYSVKVGKLDKDFWATEVLRAATFPVEVTGETDSGLLTVIFKGGTSISRVYGLIERFSEDIDRLVVFPTWAPAPEPAARRSSECAMPWMSTSALARTPWKAKRRPPA
ncbi:nucleotidyl transferase AbiEii/AbiGii toxin family protein [Nocardia neocaledoniensis]|uniref:nucleotidyl transferase AbiEii/AbiGii toxin family protein n=1 Tax=Nocardia neocaledoniensis TaxID=236511 RepID=UPI002457D317|nr:nucleotidyl transferase AbiEii/AbiGii toxin family protein [Nocardia neocaledoniensis]